MSEWVSVGAGLPPLWEDVRVRIGRQGSDDHREDIAYLGLDGWAGDVVLTRGVDIVTHWQALDDDEFLASLYEGEE